MVVCIVGPTNSPSSQRRLPWGELDKWPAIKSRWSGFKEAITYLGCIHLHFKLISSARLSHWIPKSVKRNISARKAAWEKYLALGTKKTVLEHTHQPGGVHVQENESVYHTNLVLVSPCETLIYYFSAQRSRTSLFWPDVRELLWVPMRKRWMWLITAWQMTTWPIMQINKWLPITYY